MALIPPIKDNDWVSVRQALQKLSATRLGPDATPTFAGISIQGNATVSTLDAVSAVISAGSFVSLYSQSFVCLSATVSAGTFTSTDLGKAYSSSFACLSAVISAGAFTSVDLGKAYSSSFVVLSTTVSAGVFNSIDLGRAYGSSLVALSVVVSAGTFTSIDFTRLAGTSATISSLAVTSFAVGLGTVAPVADFHIAGNIRIEAESQFWAEGLSIATLSSQGYGLLSYHRCTNIGQSYNTTTIRWAAGLYDDENYRIIEDNENTRLFIENTTGNIGVQITAPTATLHVSGNAIVSTIDAVSAVISAGSLISLYTQSFVCLSATVSAGAFNSVDLGKAYGSSFTCLSAIVSAGTFTSIDFTRIAGISATVSSLLVLGHILTDANAQSAFDRYIGVAGGAGVISNTSGMKIENTAGGDTLLHFQTGDWGVSLGTRMTIDETGDVSMLAMRSGATQSAAGAAANELWKTSGHATLTDNIVMIGV